ncbi:hypothetical protein [Megasphaera sp.]|uniref:hypothetical protein n=1 Tax=Megasphaera sp. TaxID=2023260 RepID=UPI003F7EAFF3
MKFGRFKPYSYYKDSLDGTEHYEFHFRNGCMARVIRGSSRYDGPENLYELTVLKKRSDYWELYYRTPITDDVLGGMATRTTMKYLEEIIMKYLEEINRI